jgi:hypothetical protein
MCRRNDGRMDQTTQSSRGVTDPLGTGRWAVVVASQGGRRRHDRLCRWKPSGGTLKPDDRVVAIAGGLARPGIDVRHITLQSYIGLTVGGASNAVVLEVSSASGRFINNESWIVTDVSATVKRVVYVRDDRIQVGERVAFSYERGGELAVGSVTIKAGVLLGVRAGRSYLVFLNRREDRSWYPVDVLFEITRAGRVVDPARYVVPIDDEFFPELVINNARFNLVLRLIREELRDAQTHVGHRDENGLTPNSRTPPDNRAGSEEPERKSRRASHRFAHFGAVTAFRPITGLRLRTRFLPRSTPAWRFPDTRPTGTAVRCRSGSRRYAAPCPCRRRG